LTGKEARLRLSRVFAAARVTSLAVVDSMEARDAMVSGGMDTGVVEGYAKLDALLAQD